MTKGNCLIACGGGPTHVINQSLVAAALEAMKNDNVGDVFAPVHGVDGIVQERFYDLKREDPRNLELVANTPGAAPGSTRTKPSEIMLEQILEVLKKRDIRTFLYNGGQDTALALKKLKDMARHIGYDEVEVHVPKTIDGDLVVNDHSIGYPSAARYVAGVFGGLNFDNMSLPGIFVGKIMGRDSGFLPAASSLGRTSERDGPHLVYLPERPQTVEQVLKDIGEVYRKLGFCLVAMSEGLRAPYENSTIPFEAALTNYLKEEYGFGIDFGRMSEDVLKKKDSFGHPELSSYPLFELLLQFALVAKYQDRVRVQALGYPQRSFLNDVSRIDVEEARLVGRKAVEYALSGKYDSGSVVLLRAPGNDYSVYTELRKLEEVAGLTKYLPDEYIGSDGKSIAPAFREYGEPLIGKLPETGFLRHEVRY